MLKKVIFFVFVLLGSSQVAKTQEPPVIEDAILMNAYEDTLGLLAHMIVNDSIEMNKFRAVHSFIPTFVKALKQKNSFYYPFKQISSYISMVYPPDSTFRVITWQVAGDGIFRNYGAIQMAGEELVLHPLIDRSDSFPDVVNRQLPPDLWFGAIYYRLMPIGKGSKTKYLLFGFDHANPLERRKVLDVLSFDKGLPVFGAPIIHFPDKVLHRFILPYYARASVSLNYNEEKEMIIYDHLMSMTDQGGHSVVVPDGTYEGFVVKRNKLVHVEKVFNLKMEEPLRPMPVLDGRKKDIIGRN